LRSRGATQAEKSTLDVNRRGIQPRWMRARSASADIAVEESRSREVENETAGQPDGQTARHRVGATPAAAPASLASLDPPASTTPATPAVQDDAGSFLCEACQ